MSDVLSDTVNATSDPLADEALAFADDYTAVGPLEIIRDADALAAVIEPACRQVVATTDRLKAVKGLMGPLISYLRGETQRDGFFKTPGVAQFVAAIRDEGLVGDRLSGKAQIAFEIKKVITSMNKCMEGPGFAERYARWAASPIGDMLARSNSMDAQGGSAPAVVFQIPLDNINNLLRAQLMGVTADYVDASKRGAAKAEYLAGDSELHIVVDPVAAIEKKTRDLVEDYNEDHCDQLWDSAAASYGARVATNPICDPQKGTPLAKCTRKLYAAVCSNPGAFLALWFIGIPQGAGKNTLERGGHTFDLDDMLSNAFLELTRYLWVECWHPAAIINWLLYDCIDFRLKGVALGIMVELDCVAGISEHSAQKVQRLGNRLIHIQCVLSRILQDLKSELEDDYHPCAVTCASGDAVGMLLRQMSEHSPEPTHSMQRDPAPGQLIGSPVLSLTSFIAGSCPEKATVARAVVLADCIHSVLHLSFAAGQMAQAVRGPEGGAVGPASLADAKAGLEMLERRAKQCAADAEAYAADHPGALRRGITMEPHERLHVECLAEALNATSFVTSAKLSHAVGDTCGQVMKMAGARLQGANVAFAEFDTKKFTPACTAAMFQSNLHYFDLRYSGDGWADFALSTLGHAQSSRIVLTCSDRMMHQDRALLPGMGKIVGGRHDSCRCLDFSLHEELHEPAVRRAVGANRSLFSMCNGNVSQGFNVNESTMYGILTYSGAHAGSKALLNGDDQLRSRTAAYCNNEWRRLWGSEEPPELLWAGGHLDLLSIMANAMSLTIHHAVDAVSGAQANSKNAHILCADTNSGGTVTFSGVVSGGGVVMRTQDGAFQDILTEVSERSTPAFISHCFRHIRKSQSSESLDDRVMSKVVDYVRHKLINLCASWAATMTYRTSRGSEETSTWPDEMRAYVNAWGGPISIWSGSDAVLEMGVKPMVDELSRVQEDPAAPAFAKDLARQGFLVLPKGPPARINASDMEGFGSINRETNVDKLRELSERFPSLAGSVNLRSKVVTIPFAVWYSQHYASHIPLLSPEDYANETAIDLRSALGLSPGAGMKKVCTYRGDAVPGLPRVSISSAVLKPWSGGSRYQPDSAAKAAALVDSIQCVTGNSRMMTCMMVPCYVSNRSTAIMDNAVPVGGTYSKPNSTVHALFGPDLEFTISDEVGGAATIRGAVRPSKKGMCAMWSGPGSDPKANAKMVSFCNYVSNRIGVNVSHRPRALELRGLAVNGELIDAGDPLTQYGFRRLPIGWSCTDPGRPSLHQVKLHVVATREMTMHANTSNWHECRLAETDYSVSWAVINRIVPKVYNAPVSCGDTLSTGDLHDDSDSRLPSLSRIVNGPEFSLTYVPSEYDQLAAAFGGDSTLALAGYIYLQKGARRCGPDQQLTGNWHVILPDGETDEVYLSTAPDDPMQRLTRSRPGNVSPGAAASAALLPARGSGPRQPGRAAGLSQTLRFLSNETLVGALALLLINHSRPGYASQA